MSLFVAQHKGKVNMPLCMPWKHIQKAEV